MQSVVQGLMGVARRLKGVLALSAFVTPVVLAGCESNNQSLYVAGALVPVRGGEGGSCLYTPGTNVYLLDPTLDVGLANRYTAVFEVRNQLVVREDYTNARSEPNRFVVTGAEVRLVDLVANRETSFTSLASGSVAQPQSGAGGIGAAVVPVTVVDPETSARVFNELKPFEERQLIAYIKMFGESLGNKPIESAEYQFAVTVCKQCLVSFPAEARDTTIPQNNCNRPRSSAGTLLPCNFGQDNVVDCRDCASNPFCQPPP
jgi:hypothetical protein